MKRVLLLDDSPLILEVLEEVCSNAGYAVKAMSTAIGLTKEVKSFDPHVIVMDVEMPALNGNRAMELLSRFNLLEGRSVLFFSDRPDQELESIVAQTGANGYVRKSEDHSGLLRAIEQLMTKAN